MNTLSKILAAFFILLTGPLGIPVIIILMLLGCFPPVMMF